MEFNYNLHFQFVAFVLFGLVSTLFITRRKLGIMREKVFTYLLYAGFSSFILDTLSIILMQQTFFTDQNVIDIIRRLYLYSVDVVAFCVVLYTLAEIYQVDIFSMVWRYLYIIPLVIALPLISFLPIQKDAISYEFSYAVYASMGITIVYLIICWVYVILMHSVLERYRLNAIVFACLVFFGCGLFQLFYQQLRLMSLGISIFLVYMYLGLENPGEYIEKETGCFNINGLESYMKNHCTQNNKVSLIFITIKQYDNSNTYSLSKGREAMRMGVIEYFNSLAFVKVFTLPGDAYLLAYESEEHFIQLVQKIRDRFREAWTVSYQEVMVELEVHATIVGYPAIRMPNNPKYEDIMSTLYHFVDGAIETDEGYIVIDRRHLFDKQIHDRIEVELKDAVAEKRVEVLYQPVFSVAESRCNEAEAIMYIRDRKGNFLPTKDAMDVAEENGCIIELGYEVFSQICHFITSHDLKHIGISNITMHLSLLQCQEKDLADKLISIMDEYNIPAYYFRFEISEETVAYFTRNFRRNVNRLTALGAAFEIDDYGKFALNPDRVTKVSQRYIKIGEDVVSAYFAGRKTRQYMRALCRMLNQLKFVVTAVGVKTQQQYMELKAMGVHMMQGDAFYKPMQPEEFIETLEKERAIVLGQEVLYERVL